MRNFSNFIQDHVRRRGVSLRRLALESGVSPSTFSRWLRGQQRPSPASCQKLAEYLDSEAETRSQVRGAMVYPIIIAIMAVTVTIFLLCFVLPRFTAIFAGKEHLLPAATKVPFP